MAEVGGIDTAAHLAAKTGDLVPARRLAGVSFRREPSLSTRISPSNLEVKGPQPVRMRTLREQKETRRPSSTKKYYGNMTAAERGKCSGYMVCGKGIDFEKKARKEMPAMHRLL
ncbi:MAG: hypothetical protein LJE70_20605 [Chromatiaceae bacterium]|nr:hypothetical protein [Chromatiaceae bacterium]